MDMIIVAPLWVRHLLYCTYFLLIMVIVIMSVLIVRNIIASMIESLRDFLIRALFGFED
ncbi:hypothetical protein F5Y06DRAFT_294399 [Hypoxylon sp. FL0890]|nr:hypothetical protein F5Y06DRAFT_294399 [Hypoxylon sp. FL0890]